MTEHPPLATSNNSADVSPEPSSHRQALGIIFLVVLMDLIGFGMVVPLLPVYTRQFASDGRAIGLLMASYSAMQFIFAPLWGRLSDKIGRRKVLLVSLLASVGSWLLFAYATSYSMLLLARLCAGICNANISVATAYVTDITSGAQRTKAMGLIGAAFGLGFVLGPFVGGEISAHFGGEVLGLTVATISFLNFCWAYVFLRESLSPAMMQACAVKLRQGGFSLIWQERWQFFQEKKKTLGPYLLLSFLQVLSFSMLEMCVALWLEQRFHFDLLQTGRVFGAVGLVLAVVQGGLIGLLSKRWGDLYILRLAYLLGLMGMLAAALGAGHWLLGLGIALSLVVLGQALSHPALQSLLSKVAPVTERGLTMGLHQSLGALARLSGPLLAGYAIYLGDLELPMFLGSIFYLLALWTSRKC